MMKVRDILRRIQACKTSSDFIRKNFTTQQNVEAKAMAAKTNNT
jgi:hypothetical protein